MKPFPTSGDVLSNICVYEVVIIPDVGEIGRGFEVCPAVLSGLITLHTRSCCKIANVGLHPFEGGMCWAKLCKVKIYSYIYSALPDETEAVNWEDNISRSTSLRPLFYYHWLTTSPQVSSGE